jgi:hypothetical protein
MEGQKDTGVVCIRPNDISEWYLLQCRAYPSRPGSPWATSLGVGLLGHTYACLPARLHGLPSVPLRSLGEQAGCLPSLPSLPYRMPAMQLGFQASDLEVVVFD